MARVSKEHAETELDAFLESMDYDMDKADWSTYVNTAYGIIVKSVCKGLTTFTGGQPVISVGGQEYTLHPIKIADIIETQKKSSGELEDEITIVSKFAKCSEGKNLPISVMRDWRPSQLAPFQAFSLFLR